MDRTSSRVREFPLRALRSLRGGLLAYLCTVVGFTGAVVAAATATTTVTGRDWAWLGLLLACAVAHLEVTQGLERIRELPEGEPYTHLQSTWYIAGLLLLPPTAAGHPHRRHVRLRVGTGLCPPCPGAPEGFLRLRRRARRRRSHARALGALSGLRRALRDRARRAAWRGRDRAGGVDLPVVRPRTALPACKLATGHASRSWLGCPPMMDRGERTPSACRSVVLWIYHGSPRTSGRPIDRTFNRDVGSRLQGIAMSSTSPSIR